MSKHTPGPWRACATGQIVAGPASKSVARIWNTKNREADSANARLIAAAPELLEALERAEESLCLAESMFDMHQDDSPNFEAAILEARAAIAKARGEA